MFGYLEDMFTYIFIILKYYIYICKFQGEKNPNFQGFQELFEH